MSKCRVVQFLVILLFVPQVLADPIVYPAKGQSAEQQEKDKFECYSWAKQETGFDPLSATDTATTQAQTTRGRAVKGALAGAATGAIIGDKSKYAARGAAAGALIGGVSQASSNRKAQQSAQSANADVAAHRNQYDRAYAACLEGRGYSVN